MSRTLVTSGECVAVAPVRVLDAATNWRLHSAWFVNLYGSVPVFHEWRDSEWRDRGGVTVDSWRDLPVDEPCDFYTLARCGRALMHDHHPDGPSERGVTRRTGDWLPVRFAVLFATPCARCYPAGVIVVE